METVKLSNVTKSFKDVVAVDGVSFSIESGKIFGILGPNGAGKTTTIRMIAGIFLPDRGEIRVFK
ncbi:MAG: ATP-binding cassette domain-containing protein, partial [Candidatus Kapaibacteriota bacterium]